MTPREELQALYDRIPAIACKRECQRSCASNVIEMGAMSVLEFDRLSMGGDLPHAAGLVESCVLLINDRCSLYAQRPLICRLWGVVDAPFMRCPWGCVPERWLTEAESREMLAEAERIGGGMKGPR